MEKKIPKIIHYVWVGGGKKSDLILKCLETFKKLNPDYEIKEWNEINSGMKDNAFVKTALEQKNWALAADVIRIKMLMEHGGIYLDTDMELLKPLDDLLDNEFFIGYENHLWLNTAVIGCVKGHKVITEAYERYKGELKMTFSANVLTVHNFSAVVKKLYGVKLDGKTVELPDGVKLYAQDYFYPQNYITLRTNITENTCMIHHYTATWHSKAKRLGARFARRIRLMFGKHFFSIFERMARRSFLKTLNKEVKLREKQNEKKKD